MDNLIKELIEDFKKEENKLEKQNEKTNKETKLVFKSNEKGNVEVVGVYGSESALLSAICVILQEIEKHSENSAEHMATLILTALEMRKKNR